MVIFEKILRFPKMSNNTIQASDTSKVLGISAVDKLTIGRQRSACIGSTEKKNWTYWTLIYEQASTEDPQGTYSH